MPGTRGGRDAERRNVGDDEARVDAAQERRLARRRDRRTSSMNARARRTLSRGVEVQAVDLHDAGVDVSVLDVLERRDSAVVGPGFSPACDPRALA